MTGVLGMGQLSLSHKINAHEYDKKSSGIGSDVIPRNPVAKISITDHEINVLNIQAGLTIRQNDTFDHICNESYVNVGPPNQNHD